MTSLEPLHMGNAGDEGYCRSAIELLMLIGFCAIAVCDRRWIELEQHTGGLRQTFGA